MSFDWPRLNGEVYALPREGSWPFINDIILGPKSQELSTCKGLFALIPHVVLLGEPLWLADNRTKHLVPISLVSPVAKGHCSQAHGLACEERRDPLRWDAILLCRDCFRQCRSI